jgi:ATP-dependent RNA helicase RhlE
MQFTASSLSSAQNHPIDRPGYAGAFPQDLRASGDASDSIGRRACAYVKVIVLTLFTDLGLAAPLLKALASEGYTQPTPIQAQAIPSVLEGRDLLGIAQTGTGKTAAFALPILQRLAADKKAAPRRGCRCLVLSPTRELASQIAESFRSYGRHMGMTVAVIFGGAKYGPQIKALAGGIDILVATPGRLIDHINRGTIDLSHVKMLVLDEADQMLQMGFQEDVELIMAAMPAERTTALFSATMPKPILDIVGRYMRDPRWST